MGDGKDIGGIGEGIGVSVQIIKGMGSSCKRIKGH